MEENQEPSPGLLTRVTPRFPIYLKKHRNKNGPTNSFKSTGSPTSSISLLSRLSESPIHPATINCPSNRTLIDRLEAHSPTLTAETAGVPTAQLSDRLSSTEILATLQNSVALQDMLRSAQDSSADTAEIDINNEALGSSPIIVEDNSVCHFYILLLTHGQRIETSFTKASEQAEKATPVAEGYSLSQIPPSSSTSSAAGVEDQLMLGHSDPNSPVESPSLQEPLPSEIQPDTLQKCRDLIIPLILRNAKARDSEPDSDTLEKMKALVTDEVCAKSLTVAKDLKEQLDAKRAQKEILRKRQSGNVVIGVKRPREDGDDGNVVKNRPPHAASRISALELTERSNPTSPDKLPPRAPKAMIEQAQVRVLDKFDSTSTSILFQGSTSSLSQKMDKPALDPNILEVNGTWTEMMSFGVVVTVVETHGSRMSIPSGRETIVSDTVMTHLREKEAMIIIRHGSRTLTRTGRQAIIGTFHRPPLHILATLFLVYGLLKWVLIRLTSLMWISKCIRT